MLQLVVLCKMASLECTIQGAKQLKTVGAKWVCREAEAEQSTPLL